MSIQCRVDVGRKGKFILWNSTRSKGHFKCNILVHEHLIIFHVAFDYLLYVSDIIRAHKLLTVKQIDVNVLCQSNFFFTNVLSTDCSETLTRHSSRHFTVRKVYWA